MSHGAAVMTVDTRIVRCNEIQFACLAGIYLFGGIE